MTTSLLKMPSLSSGMSTSSTTSAMLAAAANAETFEPSERQVAAALAERMVRLDRKYGMLISMAAASSVENFIRRTLLGSMYLDLDEVYVVHLMICRMYRAVSVGKMDAIKYAQATGVKVKLLNAVYFSGTGLHDQPLAKKYFLTPSGLSWDDFIASTLDFATSVGNNTAFSDAELQASRTKLRAIARAQILKLEDDPAFAEDLHLYDEEIPEPTSKPRNTGRKRESSLKEAMRALFGRARSLSLGKTRSSSVSSSTATREEVQERKPSRAQLLAQAAQAKYEAEAAGRRRHRSSSHGSSSGSGSSGHRRHRSSSSGRRRSGNA